MHTMLTAQQMTMTWTRLQIGTQRLERLVPKRRVWMSAALPFMFIRSPS